MAREPREGSRWPHLKCREFSSANHQVEGYECQVIKGVLHALAAGFVQTLALESSGRLLARQGCSTTHLEWMLRVVGYTTVRRSITNDEGLLVAERLE